MRKLLPILYMTLHRFLPNFYLFYSEWQFLMYSTLPSPTLGNKNSLDTFLMGHWRRTEITVFKKSGACHFPDSEAHLGNRPTHTPPTSLSLSQLVRTFQNKFSSFRRTRASQSEWGGGEGRICSGTCCTKRTIRKESGAEKLIVTKKCRKYYTFLKEKEKYLL